MEQNVTFFSDGLNLSGIVNLPDGPRPGERGRRDEARQRKDGVAIDQATWVDLAQLASKVGIQIPSRNSGC